jgi:Uncharacterized alpha/beta hydrolase domain (DUF2235)
MSNPPKLRRIATIGPAENALRKSARASLDLNAGAIKSCKTCPKPIWFTAFFDGTGNNFDADGKKSNLAEQVKYSNVAKLWFFGHVDKHSLPRTTHEYIEGVGTPCPKVGDTGDGLDKAIGMSAAGKGEARIRWMLKELDMHVTDHMPAVNQINIAVFGFSRGATQARAFVRMLTEKLAHEEGGELFWARAGLDDKKPKVVVYFMGLFDTVSSVGFGGSRLEKQAPTLAEGFGRMLPGGVVLGPIAGGMLRSIDKGGHAEWANDLRIPTHVKKCVHYVAGHEVREKFPSDSIREDQTIPSNCVEVVYPGMHSDVGGGYEFSEQEQRTNELSRVSLNNMFIEAWKAGVPLKSPKEVMASAGSLFEISQRLENHWDVYMGSGGVIGISSALTTDKLESQIIWHMNRLYHWRASRRRRLRDGRLKPAGGVDAYMAITDKEWASDIVDVAESRTGWIRTNVHLHQQAMFEAFEGKWVAGLAGEVRDAFDFFFDHYVHDSIAGFKKQMKEGGVSFAEASRWSTNRQFFMGKRDDKFLYWRYEGWSPEYSGTQTAMLERTSAPAESDVLAPARANSETVIG